MYEAEQELISSLSPPWLPIEWSGLNNTSLMKHPTTGWERMVFGVGAIVVLPIFYGVVGYIMTVIAVALFNLVARWTGGLAIVIEIEPGEQTGPTPSPLPDQS